MTCGARIFSACAVLTLNGNFCVVQPNTVCRISHHLEPTGISALTVATLFPVASSSASTIDASNESISLLALSANADSARLARHSGGADIDIVVASGEINASLISQANVAVAGCVVEECIETTGSVA